MTATIPGSDVASSPVLRVYGRRGDPDSIALIIARTLAGSEVKRTGDTWRVSVGSKRPLFRQVVPDLVVEVDGTRFAGSDGERRREALREDVVRRMRGPGLESALEMMHELRIVITFTPAEGAPPISTTDRLFQVALDIASRTDGFVLSPDRGRLFSQTGQVWASTEHLLADGGTPLDPSVARVGARLVSLVAVGARALTEYDGQDLDEAREGIIQWVHTVGMSHEMESSEEAVLLRPPGELDDADLAHATWQIEGAVVLAWALSLVDRLPPLEEAVDPALLTAVVRFPQADKTKAVLRTATRRHQVVIEAEAARLFSIHWRLHEWENDPKALDIESFAQRSTSGPLRFERVPLVRGDLSIGGVPIAEADPQLVDVAYSIASERLCAVNWLRRGGPYSATDLGP